MADPCVRSDAYLEGTYSEYYPHILEIEEKDHENYLSDIPSGVFRAI